jgi:hypothetical protein
MLRRDNLRRKAAQVLRAGRREAALWQQPIARIHLELAGNYKRLAALDSMREDWVRPGRRVSASIRLA